MREATKKTAERIEALGISSERRLLRPIYNPPMLSTTPAAKTGADIIPSEICILGQAAFL
jgi:hypothetical protein